MDRYTQWAKRKFSLGQRLLALVPAGLFFVVVLPLMIYHGAAWIDRSLGWKGFGSGGWNIALGVLLALPGWGLAMWSIVTQLRQGQGTPLPVMATQRLLESGPFALCRNPMTFGTILLYLGLAVAFGSFGALLLATLLSIALIGYIRKIEERELEARFGDAYREYRMRTPFLLPQMWTRRK
jgi:protein-S-isoprenylcysteine O-methyltransferase Ste14